MNITTLQIIILIMSIFDLGATYLYVSKFHQMFPKLDYTTLEANPILRMSWKMFGLPIGMIIGGTIVFGLLALITFTLKENWRWFFAGTLAMMLIYHLINFTQLLKLKPAI